LGELKNKRSKADPLNNPVNFQLFGNTIICHGKNKRFGLLIQLVLWQEDVFLDLKSDSGGKFTIRSLNHAIHFL
jgi:hypothetical protein